MCALHCVALRCLDVQFVCMRNIQRFLQSCQQLGLRQADLFDAKELYECRDFGRVRTRRRLFLFLSLSPRAPPPRSRSKLVPLVQRLIISSDSCHSYLSRARPTVHVQCTRTMYSRIRNSSRRPLNSSRRLSALERNDHGDSSSPRLALAFLCTLVLFLCKKYY